MIDELDRRLGDWIGTVLETVDVSLAAPSGSETGRGISLYLMELLPLPPARGARRPPHQLVLRYLVTAWAETPEEAHRLLGDLIFAAMESAEFEVEPEPPPVAVWTALGLAPRPSFVLRVPLRHQRPEPVAPRVRLPLVVKGSPLQSLHGLVFGPGDVPVMGARVELPALQLSTRTDAKGRFRFPAVPIEPQARLVRVKAKGREVSVTTEQTGWSGQPLIIHLEPMEG